MPVSATMSPTVAQSTRHPRQAFICIYRTALNGPVFWPVPLQATTDPPSLQLAAPNSAVAGGPWCCRSPCGPPAPGLARRVPSVAARDRGSRPRVAACVPSPRGQAGFAFSSDGGGLDHRYRALASGSPGRGTGPVCSMHPIGERIAAFACLNNDRAGQSEARMPSAKRSASGGMGPSSASTISIAPSAMPRDSLDLAAKSACRGRKSMMFRPHFVFGRMRPLRRSNLLGDRNANDLGNGWLRPFRVRVGLPVNACRRESHPRQT